MITTEPLVSHSAQTISLDFGDHAPQHGRPAIGTNVVVSGPF